MSADDKLKFERTSQNSQPVWCAHEWPTTTANEARPGKTNLHIEGFLEGVPLNTETAAVKPRAGIK